MTFWNLLPHPERKTLPVGKDIYQYDGGLRYIVGLSQENGCVKLHVLEDHVEIWQEEARTHRALMKNSLRNTTPTLKALRIGENVYESHRSERSPLKCCQDVQLFCEFMQNGWEVPEKLMNESWDNLILCSYEIDCGEVPEIGDNCENIELVYLKGPEYFFVEQQFALKIGEPYDFSVRCGRQVVECHINDVILVDMYEEIEKQCADPRVLKAFSAERIAEMRGELLKAAEEHCPRNMRYVAIEYECSEDVDLRFELTEKLDEELKTSGSGSSSVMLVTHDLDKEYGTHGLPLKAAAIQQPVPENTKEVSVELFYACTKTE